jgi:hypothetical protein
MKKLKGLEQVFHHCFAIAPLTGAPSFGSVTAGSQAFVLVVRRQARGCPNMQAGKRQPTQPGALYAGSQALALVVAHNKLEIPPNFSLSLSYSILPSYCRTVDYLFLDFIVFTPTLHGG